jgi:hypothetical protein
MHINMFTDSDFVKELSSSFSTVAKSRSVVLWQDAA